MRQPVHHIFQTRDLPCSERSFYRHVADGAISIIPLELAKACRYKVRRRKASDPHCRAFYEGRTYDDFLALVESEGLVTHSEGDTVWGADDEPESLLTLHRPDLHFQIYLKVASRTAAEVVARLDLVESLCGSPEAFHELFDPLLVDRGSEFDDIEGIERSSLVKGARRVRLFFADPRHPEQRGSGEKNHVELRKIIPKGTSVRDITPAELAEVASHVNSTVRRGCGNATPMALASLVFPEGLLEGLGYRLVPPSEVVCRPGILPGT